MPRPADLTAAIIHDPLTIGPDCSVMDAIALMGGMRILCPTDRDHIVEDNLHLEAKVRAKKQREIVLGCQTCGRDSEHIVRTCGGSVDRKPMWA